VKFSFFFRLKSKYKHIIVIVSIFFISFVYVKDDLYLKISKSLEIFGKVFKEVILEYVDEVDPSELVDKTISKMLKNLDHTQFILIKFQMNSSLLQVGNMQGSGLL